MLFILVYDSPKWSAMPKTVLMYCGSVLFNTLRSLISLRSSERGSSFMGSLLFEQLVGRDEPELGVVRFADLDAPLFAEDLAI